MTPSKKTAWFRIVLRIPFSVFRFESRLFLNVFAVRKGATVNPCGNRRIHGTARMSSSLLPAVRLKPLHVHSRPSERCFAKKQATFKDQCRSVRHDLLSKARAKETVSSHVLVSARKKPISPQGIFLSHCFNRVILSKSYRIYDFR